MQSHMGIIENELEYISKYERNINTFCSTQREDLRVIVDEKKQLYQILNKKTENVQEKIKNFEDIQDKYDTITEELDRKGDALDGSSRYEMVRKAINRLRVYHYMFI